MLAVDDPWAAYCLDEALALKAANADAGTDGEQGAGFQQRLGPPTRSELARIPWAGDGPDPLAEPGAE